MQIAQKTVKDTPTDKLYDAWISLLAGAHGLVEFNTRLRADTALQRAFGRSHCTEQSVVQDTLNACTAENVEQMQHAMDRIYRQQSQGFGHDYQASFQVLDVDMSDLPCGPKAAFATKGYFAAEVTLHLDADKCRRTIVRVDAGGGSLADVNGPLAATWSTAKTIRASKLNAWPGASPTGTPIPISPSVSSAG